MLAPLSTRAVVGLLVGLCLAYFCSLRFFRSEEAKIRELLSELVSKAKTTATESPLTRLQDVRALSAFFSDDLIFRLDDGSGDEPREVARSKKDLEQQALAAKTSFRSLEAVLLSPSVELQGEAASAEAEIHVLGSLPDMEGQFYEHHLVTFKLIKTEQVWKISAISSKNLRSGDRPPEAIFKE